MLHPAVFLMGRRRCICCWCLWCTSITTRFAKFRLLKCSNHRFRSASGRLCSAMTAYWFLPDEQRTKSGVVHIYYHSVCKLHLDGVCGFGADCRRIHICRDFKDTINEMADGTRSITPWNPRSFQTKDSGHQCDRMPRWSHTPRTIPSSSQQSYCRRVHSGVSPHGIMIRSVGSTASSSLASLDFGKHALIKRSLR